MIIHAHQAQWAEMRAAAHSVRGLMAFEAAEAGRAWGQTMLTTSARINPSCQPDPTLSPSTPSFRQRLMRFDPATGRHQATPSGLWQPACVVQGGAWQCTCPDQGAAALPSPDPSAQDGDHPAFSVRMTPLAAPAPAGHVELISTGCANPSLGCGGSQVAEAQAQVKIILAPIGGLRSMPQATLSAGGTIEARGPSGFINTDPHSMGLALAAGGSIQRAPEVHIMGLPGSPPQAAVLAFDPGLQDPVLQGSANLRSSDWPLRLFGLPSSRLMHLPHWVRPNCPQGICDVIATQTALQQGATALWLQGDLRLTGPQTIGRPDQPVILVTEGHLQLQGEVHVHGFILAQRLSWIDVGSAATTHLPSSTLDGAAVVQTDTVIDGRIVLNRDPTVLQRLKIDVGTWVMLPGRWRDHEP